MSPGVSWRGVGSASGAEAPLEVGIGPGLVFRFEGLAEPLRRRIAGALDYHLGRSGGAGARPIRVLAGRPPRSRPRDALPVDARSARRTDDDPQGASPVLAEPPLVVRRSGPNVLFELPGLVSGCDAERGVGFVGSPPPDGRALDTWTRLVLPPLLVELAVARGWQGLHAAAIARSGRGILLPGPNGCGKSTVFRGAWRAGWEVLSDDLVWLREAGGGWRIHAFPRRPRDPDTPEPTADGVELRAIVFPQISARPGNRLGDVEPSDALGRLADQAGFLAGGAAAGARFAALARLASAAPTLVLEAGADRAAVPGMLRRLLGPS